MACISLAGVGSAEQRCSTYFVFSSSWGKGGNGRFSTPPPPSPRPPSCLEDEKDMYGGGASIKKSQPYKAQQGCMEADMQTTMYGLKHVHLFMTGEQVRVKAD